MKDEVRLRPLDEAGLAELLEVAVADASPDEVMPPMDGQPGWTAERRAGFIDFFRPMLTAGDAKIYAVTVGGAIAGFMRLKRISPTEAETGMWLGRSWRGRGIAARALRRVLAEAARAGYAKVLADTTPENVAALGTLRHGAAQTIAKDGKIYAEMAIDPAYAYDLDK